MPLRSACVSVPSLQVSVSSRLDCAVPPPNQRRMPRYSTEPAQWESMKTPAENRRQSLKPRSRNTQGNPPLTGLTFAASECKFALPPDAAPSRSRARPASVHAPATMRCSCVRGQSQFSVPACGEARHARASPRTNPRTRAQERTRNRTYPSLERRLLRARHHAHGVARRCPEHGVLDRLFHTCTVVPRLGSRV